MAVEVDRGFSIREHVAKQRSSDVSKCRPFDGEALPPMDVHKFRWWSDEAAAAVAAAPPPLKQKTPKKKKRSIVELFAISPQITAVGGETEGSDEEMEGLANLQTGEEERVEETADGEGLYSAHFLALHKREEKENKSQLKNRRGDKSKKMKKKVEKKELQIKICAGQKEKIRKPKIKSSLSISQLLQEVKRKKMLKKSLKLPFQAKNKKKKKKKFPSILSKKENNLKISPKSTPKSKTNNLSGHSILKKRAKTSPLKKQVTFSGKDDIFGREEESSSSPVELLPVQSAGFPVAEEPESVKVREIADKEPDITTVRNETRIEQEKENSSLRKYVDLNQMLESSDTCIEIREGFLRVRPDVMVEIAREPSGSCLIDKHQASHADASGSLPRTSISNKDLISVSSSTGSNKSTSADTRLNTDCISNPSFREEFVGLPLNSQGELAINPKPNPIPNYSELFKRNEMFSVPLSGVPCPGPVPLPVRPITTARTNQTDVRMGPLYFKDKFGMEHYYAPLMPVRPGFGFMHLPGFERMEIQSHDPRDPLLDHTSKPTDFYQMRKNSAELTFRLMGKNVSVGRSSKDCMGLDNISVCVDKGNGPLNRDDFAFSRERNQDMSFSVEPWFNEPLSGGRNQGLAFSIEPPFNEPRGQVHSHAGIAFSNRYSARPVPHVNPVITCYNGFGCQRPAVGQQAILNSTHCKHSLSQSQSLSFATSSGQAEIPQWIQNPRSKTHKPSFPSYVSPTVGVKQPHVVSGNRPNSSSPYLGTANSFPAYNSRSSYSHSHPCISIPPLNSTFIPPYLAARPNFAANNKGKVQMKSKFHFLKPSDYINKNNKRPLERDAGFVRPPPKRLCQTDVGLIAEPRGPNTSVGIREMHNFGISVGKAVNTQIANTKMNELGNGISGPGSGFVVRSGPVKLSAGARHVLKPGPDLDTVNPRPIHSTMPLMGGASLSKKRAEEIYQF